MGKRGPQPRYPWDKWFDAVKAGKSVRLRYMKDYDCTPLSMETQIRQRASGLGIPLTVSHETTQGRPDTHVLIFRKRER